MCPPCVRHLSALRCPCPPLVRLVSTLCCFGRASTPCPPLVRCPRCVRLVLLALAAPPVLVRDLSALCPPCVVGFCPLCVRLVLLAFVRHVPALRPPCVRLLFAAPPPCVHLAFASCPLWPCLLTLSAMCPACVALCLLWPCLQTLSAMCPFVPALAAPRHVSGTPPCVRLALYTPCVGFGRASKRCVSYVALCVRHLSAPCLFFVLSLSARFSLFIRSFSLFALVYGLALAGPLSALRPLFGFCAFVCSVSVVVHLSRGLCGRAFARCSSGHL